MSVWRINFDPGHLYFITTRAIQRAHIFQRDVIKQILVDSFDYMQKNHWLELYAFVIMPNHIRFIARFLDGHPVSDVVRDFKKHTSKSVVAHYELESNEKALRFLHQAVKRSEKQKYAVWEDEFQAKDVFSPQFMKQKMEYIHNNPLQPHWRLAEKPEDYAWSSARYYLLGEPAMVPLHDARLLLS
ncbi:MAG: transposase [Chloroflexota bacterium]